MLVGLGVMCASMAVRAVAWHAILKAAIPRGRVRLRDAMQGTFIGVLMSATLPARLGEPSRALIVARRTGRPREHLPVVLGTIVSQTLLNILALVLLGIVTFSTVRLFRNHHDALIFAAIMPLLLLALVLLAPPLLSAGRHSRFAKLRELTGQARDALARVRDGLAVFRDPRLGGTAVAAQLAAWALQWLSCYVLLVALGLDHQRRPRRRRGGAVRGQRDGGAAGDAVEPRHLPGGLRRRAERRLRRLAGRRARLRDHPAGGRDRDRRRDGDAGAREGGPVVEGRAPARAPDGAGRAARAPARQAAAASRSRAASEA